MPPRPTKVAVIGAGLVGSEFLSQLSALAGKYTLVSLSSSKRTLFNPAGLDISSKDKWTAALSSSSNTTTLPTLLSDLKPLIGQGDRVIVVDNTSSESVAAFYPRLLEAGIHIVTPNKKAFSGPLELYDAIGESALRGSATVLNEATVGAGLPIVSTLKDLVATGDRVVKIEGVLSGTLSYIFNEFSKVGGGGPSFSSVVKIARDKGYTEPHPGDDLNGADVARKLTILSRLIPDLANALPHGFKSVSITSLVPSELEHVTSADEFVARLHEFDGRYEALREEAQRKGKVLRYAGVIDVEARKISAALEEYPVDHPFATSLGGSDNIIAFHTERYGARPLLVQGAGAGAAVTAMGVLSDVLKLP